MKHQIVILIFTALAVVGCGEGKSEQETELNQMEQIISELTAEDVARVTKQRAVVEIYLGDEDSRRKYKKGPGKLGLLRTLLQHNVFKPNQTYELQCMGIVLGDVFVQELGMQWIMVEDEYGKDPAVKLDGTSIITVSVDDDFEAS